MEMIEKQVSSLRTELSDLLTDEETKRHLFYQGRANIQEIWNKSMDLQSHIQVVEYEMEKTRIESLTYDTDISLKIGKFEFTTDTDSRVSLQTALERTKKAELSEQVRLKDKQTSIVTKLEEKISRTQKRLQTYTEALKDSLDNKTKYNETVETESFQRSMDLRQLVVKTSDLLNDLEIDYVTACEDLEKTSNTIHHGLREVEANAVLLPADTNRREILQRNAQSIEQIDALRYANHEFSVSNKMIEKTLESPRSLIAKSQQIVLDECAMDIITQGIPFSPDLITFIKSGGRNFPCEEILRDFTDLPGEKETSPLHLRFPRDRPKLVQAEFSMQEVLSGDVTIHRLNGETTTSYVERLRRRRGSFRVLALDVFQEFHEKWADVRRLRERLRDSEMKRLRMELNVSNVEQLLKDRRWKSRYHQLNELNQRQNFISPDSEYFPTISPNKFGSPTKPISPIRTRKDSPQTGESPLFDVSRNSRREVRHRSDSDKYLLMTQEEANLHATNLMKIILNIRTNPSNGSSRSPVTAAASGAGEPEFVWEKHLEGSPSRRNSPRVGSRVGPGDPEGQLPAREDLQEMILQYLRDEGLDPVAHYGVMVKAVKVRILSELLRRDLSTGDASTAAVEAMGVASSPALKEYLKRGSTRSPSQKRGKDEIERVFNDVSEEMKGDRKNEGFIDEEKVIKPSSIDNLIPPLTPKQSRNPSSTQKAAGSKSPKAQSHSGKVKNPKKVQYAEVKKEKSPKNSRNPKTNTTTNLQQPATRSEKPIEMTNKPVEPSSSSTSKPKSESKVENHTQPFVPMSPLLDRAIPLYQLKESSRSQPIDLPDLTRPQLRGSSHKNHVMEPTFASGQKPPLLLTSPLKGSFNPLKDPHHIIPHQFQPSVGPSNRDTGPSSTLFANEDDDNDDDHHVPSAQQRYLGNSSHNNSAIDNKSSNNSASSSPERWREVLAGGENKFCRHLKKFTTCLICSHRVVFSGNPLEESPEPRFFSSQSQQESQNPRAPVTPKIDGFSPLPASNCTQSMVKKKARVSHTPNPHVPYGEGPSPQLRRNSPFRNHHFNVDHPAVALGVDRTLFPAGPFGETDGENVISGQSLAVVAPPQGLILDQPNFGKLQPSIGSFHFADRRKRRQVQEAIHRGDVSASSVLFRDFGEEAKTGLSEEKGCGLMGLDGSEHEEEVFEVPLGGDLVDLLVSGQSNFVKPNLRSTQLQKPSRSPPRRRENPEDDMIIPYAAGSNPYSTDKIQQPHVSFQTLTSPPEKNFHPTKSNNPPEENELLEEQLQHQQIEIQELRELQLSLIQQLLQQKALKTHPQKPVSPEITQPRFDPASSVNWVNAIVAAAMDISNIMNSQQSPAGAKSFPPNHENSNSEKQEIVGEENQNFINERDDTNQFNGLNNMISNFPTNGTPLAKENPKSEFRHSGMSEESGYSEVPPPPPQTDLKHSQNSASFDINVEANRCFNGLENLNNGVEAINNGIEVDEDEAATSSHFPQSVYDKLFPLFRKLEKNFTSGEFTSSNLGPSPTIPYAELDVGNPKDIVLFAVDRLQRCRRRWADTRNVSSGVGSPGGSLRSSGNGGFDFFQTHVEVAIVAARNLPEGKRSTTTTDAYVEVCLISHPLVTHHTIVNAASDALVKDSAKDEILEASWRLHRLDETVRRIHVEDEQRVNLEGISSGGESFSLLGSAGKRPRVGVAGTGGHRNSPPRAQSGPELSEPIEILNQHITPVQSNTFHPRWRDFVRLPGVISGSTARVRQSLWLGVRDCAASVGKVAAPASDNLLAQCVVPLSMELLSDQHPHVLWLPLFPPSVKRKLTKKLNPECALKIELRLFYSASKYWHHTLCESEMLLIGLKEAAENALNFDPESSEEVQKIQKLMVKHGAKKKQGYATAEEWKQQGQILRALVEKDREIEESTSFEEGFRDIDKIRTNEGIEEKTPDFNENDVLLAQSLDKEPSFLFPITENETENNGLKTENEIENKYLSNSLQESKPVDSSFSNSNFQNSNQSSPEKTTVYQKGKKRKVPVKMLGLREKEQKDHLNLRGPITFGKGKSIMQ